MSRPQWNPKQPPFTAKGYCGLWGALRLRMHRIALPEWTFPSLRIAVVADLHTCWPWVSLKRSQAIIDQVNALEADLVLLSGDYLPDANLLAYHYDQQSIIPILSRLSAPLGVLAVLGNHDWGEDPEARNNGFEKSAVAEAFASEGIPCLQNANRAIPFGNKNFWIAGLDSQRGRGTKLAGLENPEAAFLGIPEGSPTILLAHEPDYFARADPRPLLQVSGHTHAGQLHVLGHRPKTPSIFGTRFADGHIIEQGRHLVVSAGIGYSGLPFRIGAPPELTLIELSALEK